MLWDRARRTVFLFGWVSAACGDASSSDANTPTSMDPQARPSASAAVAGSASGSPAVPMTARAGAGESAGGMPAAQTGAAGATVPAQGNTATTTTPSDLTPLGPGSCCPDGKCLCRAEPPAALSGDKGPHNVMQYELAGAGCVFYPSDAPPPYAAVALADGFGGSGGCDSVQIGEWGPFYASHGIVALIVETGSGDQASARAEALSGGISTLGAEALKSGSPLFGKLAGRYGTSGFSMGGGGSAIAAHADKSLLSSVAIMPWNTDAAAASGSVPTLVVCGASDGVAPCAAHGSKAYAAVDATAPKMRVTIASDSNGQPSAAMGASGGYALAFQKLFLEGDERWRPLLVMAKSDETTIK